MKWSGSQAEYSLEGEFPEMLFTISREGVIYLNAPLDRETQDQVCDYKLYTYIWFISDKLFETSTIVSIPRKVLFLRPYRLPRLL